MAKYIIDGDTLENLGNSIRSVTGSNQRFTPEEMINEVTNILNSATFILVDKDGNEYPASFLSSEPVFTATANDIRKGVTAITAEGLTVGTKEIPAYYTSEGAAVILAGKDIKITGLTHYDFTKLQALVCAFNTSLTNSVATDRVSIDGKVYPVNSTEVLSTVTVDEEHKAIDLGIKNEASTFCLVRFFTYKEVY